MSVYQSQLYGEHYTKPNEKGYQVCLDEHFTNYCYTETVVENDPKTKLPPINYSVHQVHQNGQFRCWVLMNNENGALIKEFHNDMDLCMFIEALKMSELGKIKEYVEREKNQGSWDV